MTYDVASATTPVVFCGGAGGGNGEYDAPASSPAAYILDVGVPAGGQLVQAWYTIIDNIGDTLNFGHIDVSPHNATQVNLIVNSNPGRRGRIRLRIYGLYWRP